VKASLPDRGDRSILLDVISDDARAWNQGRGEAGSSYWQQAYNTEGLSIQL
jgi:hypothetical protein